MCLTCLNCNIIDNDLHTDTSSSLILTKALLVTYSEYSDIMKTMIVPLNMYFLTSICLNVTPLSRIDYNSEVNITSYGYL